MYFFLSEPQPPHGRRVTTTVTPRRPARKAKIQNQKPQRPAHQRSHAAFTHPHRWPFQRQAWWALWHPNLTRSLSCSHFSTDPTCARERWLRICSAFAHAHPHAAAHSLMPHEAGHMPRRYINIQTRKQALPSWLQRPPEMPAGCIKQVHKPSVSIGKTRAASSIFRSPRSTGSGARACSPARRPFASADFFFEITVLSLGGILLMA
jgi:hypothetical protein